MLSAHAMDDSRTSTEHRGGHREQDPRELHIKQTKSSRYCFPTPKTQDPSSSKPIRGSRSASTPAACQPYLITTVLASNRDSTVQLFCPSGCSLAARTLYKTTSPTSPISRYDGRTYLQHSHNSTPLARKRGIRKRTFRNVSDATREKLGHQIGLRLPEVSNHAYMRCLASVSQPRWWSRDPVRWTRELADREIFWRWRA
ncbi:hypothetical protein BDV95DRAFT_283433 [Massariosphaeria phaeospora]|uniref:Uncharacterized protein n=1 Tax=Massariosphaeria phaeospora TaxID=100035 RepID=A0A7C8IEF3_9PLEO|nr:hypothetical protein BDV95DRAFT_283433 [Massariosphaeria phaeospora]